MSDGARLIATGLSSLMVSREKILEEVWKPSPLKLSLNSNGFLGEMRNFLKAWTDRERQMDS